MNGLRTKLLFAIVHLTILAAPVALLGRGAALIQTHAIICMLLLVLFSLVESQQASIEQRNHSATVGREEGSGLALVSGLSLLGIAWSAIGSFVEASSLFFSFFSFASFAPVFLVGGGILLRWLAMRDLGVGFTSRIRPGETLGVRGIYARVRHPSELGLLLIGGGIVLLGPSVLGLLIFALVMVPCSGLRLIREERALSAQFGALHARYRTEVHALFLTIT